MAITNAIMQMRRGNESDFDPDKMKPGEWAVSTDKQYVRMCFSPGVCVRMATYDAFEVDMAQIEKILEECQTIEDAVKQIQSEIDAKEIVIEKYVQDAKTYSEMASDEADRATLEADRAKAEADRASSIANIGIATTEKTGLVKPDGTTITVDEDGTIHASEGTTDYEDLANKPQIEGVKLSGNKSLSDFGIASATDLQKVETKVDTIIEKAELNIKNSASGKNIHLTDSANGKNVAFGLYGKATQDGEPTPDNPIEITVSGSDGSVEVVSCEKNLLKNTATTQTKGGIAFTVNNDGSINITGTETSGTNNGIMLTNTLVLPKGKYIISHNYSGSYSTIWMFVRNKDTNSSILDVLSSEKIVDLTEDTTIQVSIYVKAGATINSATLYPMIRLASDTDNTYEPYKETVSTIPTTDGLCGIKVSSGGNYVDENGQQWICDEVVKYADGSGKRIQRIGKAVFDGSETWNYLQRTDRELLFTNALNGLGKDGKSLVPFMCDYFKSYNGGVHWEGYNGTFPIMLNTATSNTQCSILTKVGTYGSANTWKEWLTSNPITVYYELAEPIITDLSAEEIAEIEKLHTFYPVTNISNDADCGMSITYMADAKNYIDNRLALIESAMLNNI